MSERESQGKVAVHIWRGVNQRQQVARLQDGYCVFTQGLFAGFNSSLERLPGKKLLATLTQPVWGIQLMGNVALLQVGGSLYRIPVDELASGNVVYSATAPPVDVNPIISNALTFVSEHDTNGLIYYLGTGYGVGAFSDPATTGRIERFENFGYSGPRTYTVTNRYTSTGGSPVFYGTDDFYSVPFVGIKLTVGQLLVNRYTVTIPVRIFVSGALYMRNWKLQGSNNLTAPTKAAALVAAWVDIDVQTPNTTLNGTTVLSTSPVVTPTEYFSAFRIVQYGPDSFGSDSMAMADLELYGTYQR